MLNIVGYFILELQLCMKAKTISLTIIWLFTAKLGSRFDTAPKKANNVENN